MKILIVDGQGGGMGRALVEQLKREIPHAFLMAVGTNAAATAAMLKAGADAGATGENAVIYNACRVDFIAGPMGILAPNAMHGEITPEMAMAITQSEAHKVLVPVSRCGISVAGTAEMTPALYIEEAVALLCRMAQQKK